MTNSMRFYWVSTSEGKEKEGRCLEALRGVSLMEREGVKRMVSVFKQHQ